MTPAAFLAGPLIAALALLPPQMDTPEARVMLVSIGLQESELCFRCQVHGPAHGLMQFELSGVRGVLNHAITGPILSRICLSRNVTPNAVAIYGAIVSDDILATVLARLLLYTDTRPLPALTDVNGAYAYYLRNWRPGLPRPKDWPGNHARAVSAVTSNAPDETDSDNTLI